MQEYQYGLFVFACALIMLMVSAVLWSWTQRSAPAAISLTIISLGSLYLIYLTSYRVLRRFDVPRSQLVTGRFISKKQQPTKQGGRVQRTPQGYHCLDDNDETCEPAGEQKLEARAVGGGTAHIHQQSASMVARAWRRQRSLRHQHRPGAPAAKQPRTARGSPPNAGSPATAPPMDRSESLSAVAATVGGAGGMIGLTEHEQRQLHELQRAEALGSVVSQAAVQSCAGGWIGLSAEEEYELRNMQERARASGGAGR